MTRYNAANNWQTTLDGDLGGGELDVTFDVIAAAGHPVVPFKVTIEDEILNVTEVSTNTLTATRGVEGTTRTTHDTGTKIANLFTAEVQNDLWDEVDNKLPLAGGTMTGPLNYNAQQAQNMVIRNYREQLVSSTGTGNTALNLDNANVFAHTVNANTTTTIQLTNTKAQAHSFTLILNQHADGPSIVWDFTVHWPYNIIPEVEDDTVSVFTFFTLNEGTTWYGHLVGAGYGVGT